MPPPSIAPTKSNLLKVRERLSVAREGYELLEQKREILVMELMRIVGEAKELEAEVARATSAAYAAAREATVSLGRDRAALAARGDGDAFVAARGTEAAAGMAFPVLRLSTATPAPRYALSATNAECDAAAAEFSRLATALARLASLGAMARKLAKEARRTQRRVNALEKLVIPGAEEERAFIEAALEERERDAFFALKRLKSGRHGQLPEDVASRRDIGHTAGMSARRGAG